jgi:hypothetical protein
MRQVAELLQVMFCEVWSNINIVDDNQLCSRQGAVSTQILTSLSFTLVHKRVGVPRHVQFRSGICCQINRVHECTIVLLRNEQQRSHVRMLPLNRQEPE